MKTCAECKRGLPFSSFNRRSASCDGLQRLCRDCSRAGQQEWRAQRSEVAAAYNRQWQQANADRVREKSRRYYAAHPEVRRNIRQRRQMQLRGARIFHFTAAQLADRLSMWSGCWMCGAAASQIDHVKPLSAGGAHMLANLRPACASCNASKGAQWPYPFAREGAAA